MMQNLRRILVATDLDDDTDLMLKAGTYLSRTQQAELVLLHVMPESVPTEWVDEVGMVFMRSKLDELWEQFEGEGATVYDAVVVSGIPSREICRQAEANNADLVLLGRGLKEDATPTLGVTAGRVLRNSLRPVWIVHPDHAGAIRHVLCPVDRSSTSRLALEHAIQIAQRAGSQLTVLSVATAVPDTYGRLMGSDRRKQDRQIQRARGELQAFLKGVEHAGVEWKTSVRAGHPPLEILAAAAETKCDLIVLGSVGTSGFYHAALLGSVTTKVTEALPCSIMTVDNEDFLKVRLERVIRTLESHWGDAELLLQQGDLQGAIFEFEQCLLAAPMHAAAWEGLATAYDELGDLNEAERCRQAASRIREIAGHRWDLARSLGRRDRGGMRVRR